MSTGEPIPAVYRRDDQPLGWLSWHQPNLLDRLTNKGKGLEVGSLQVDALVEHSGFLIYVSFRFHPDNGRVAFAPAKMALGIQFQSPMHGNGSVS